jgi:Tol biopolymer transport system component
MCRVRSFTRVAVLAALIVTALVAMRWRPTPPLADPVHLTYVATAHQLGVIGYRDPPGVISADRQRIAYAEGRKLYEALVGGGAALEIAAGQGQIRYVGPIGTREWLFEDAAAPIRWWIASARAPMRALFATRELRAEAAGEVPATVAVNSLRQLTISPDGQRVAAIATGPAGAELWRLALDGSAAEVVRLSRPIAFPAWSGGIVTCTVNIDGHWKLARPCSDTPAPMRPDVDVIGPLAFSADARRMYFASPNPGGIVDLWVADVATLDARRLVQFARDSYAPSTASDNAVLFKTQSYRTSVAEIDLASGELRQLSSLQAETPSYHPDGRHIAVTFGTWRRIVDDAKYPDIAQEIGVLSAWPDAGPAAEPVEVVAASDSEDQAMTWSPNGKWIALHSHREQSDDIWLRPVDRHVPDRRVSFLGRGAEVGWPRWSPDGRAVLYDGASPSSGRSVPFVIGVDQETGETTTPPHEIVVSGIAGEITHVEWLADSATFVGIAREGPGRHAIFTAPIAGGPAHVVHQFASEHDFPGLGVSPDGREVAFIAPATDGFYQIFRMLLAGGTPQQVTVDRTHKTQPAWSPDGRRMAFTIWSYDAQFWLTR